MFLAEFGKRVSLLTNVHELDERKSIIPWPKVKNIGYSKFTTTELVREVDFQSENDIKTQRRWLNIFSSFLATAFSSCDVKNI